MKRIISMMLALVLLVCLLPTAALASGNPVPKAKQAVVLVCSGIYYDHGRLRTFDSEGYYARGTAFGIYAQGDDAEIFATNAHVVSDQKGNAYDTAYICVDGADIYKENTVVACEVLYVDEQVDIAILQAEKPILGVGILPLRCAEELETGDGVYALGYPNISDKIADENNYTVEDITVTDGIISRYLTSSGVQCMAHTAAVNHGNSGGPLIDEFGNAIGINSFIYVDKSTSDLRSYAIYADYVMEAMDDLQIPYVRGSERNANGTVLLSKIPNILWILLAAAAGVVIVTVLVLLIVRHAKKRKTRTARKVPQAVRLLALAGPLRGQSWLLGDSLVIGRDYTNTVVYPADTRGVSRKHCRLQFRGTYILVTDLGSSFGTFVGGTRLPPYTPVAVGSNTEIWLGGERIRMLLQ